MRVTTKGCYGLRAMVELTRHQNGEPVLLGKISGDLSISRKYLHALLTSLKTAGLVRSSLGCHGGYRLARDPQEISIADVLRALEGPLALRECAADPDACERSGDCPCCAVWRAVGDAIDGVLSHVSLKEISKQRKKTRAR